jgi:hypothetical protein
VLDRSGRTRSFRLGRRNGSRSPSTPGRDISINDLILAAAQHAWWVLAYFLTPPALTWCIGRAHKTRRAGARNPYSTLYGVLIYMVSFPGMMAAVLVGYGLFFLRADLRSVPILLYFLPIVSMVGTWALMREQVDLDKVPGFERLSALMLAIALCFALAFVFNRIFFGVLFFGSLWGLLGVAAAFFVAFRLTMRKLAR